MSIQNYCSHFSCHGMCMVRCSAWGGYQFVSPHIGLQCLTNKMEKSEQMLSWHRILQLLVHAVKLYPHASTISHKSSVSAVDAHCQWSEISELWFLAMQG